jgi:hypothetical protein
LAWRVVTLVNKDNYFFDTLERKIASIQNP